MYSDRSVHDGRASKDSPAHRGDDPVVGDIDCDDDVNMADVAHFAAAVTGP
jgi:hypothetical protein